MQKSMNSAGIGMMSWSPRKCCNEKNGVSMRKVAFVLIDSVSFNQHSLQSRRRAKQFLFPMDIPFRNGHVKQKDLPASSHGGASAAAAALNPLYQQVRQSLRDSLQAGEWKPLEVIPSEVMLARRYNVSLGTVRKAIDELVTEGLLVRRQGKGTFVASHGEQQMRHRFLRLQSDQPDVIATRQTQRNIVECRRLRAPAELARALHLNSGDTLLYVRRVLSFAGIPTVLEDIWLPALPFRGLTAEKLRDYPDSTYVLFEKEFGVRMVRAEEKLRATLSDADQAELLQCEVGTPLLQIERISYTFNDQPVEIRRVLNRTDRHHYRNTLG